MKVIRILLCMVFCLIVFVTTLRAEEKEIMFYVYKTSTDETDLPKSDRSITGDITVFLDRGELLLYPLFIDKFSLKLTSVDGAVLFDETIYVSSSSIYIQIPDYNENIEYLIEIEYDDAYLYGIIDN